MSSEIRKYKDKDKVLEEKENIFIADIISFPEDKKKSISKDTKINNHKTWKLYDKSNEKDDRDQFKAVTGICFMIIALFMMGLYSSLI